MTNTALEQINTGLEKIQATILLHRDLEPNQATHLFRDFDVTIGVLTQLYDMTIDGHKHSEVTHAQLIDKIGAKAEDSLTRKELRGSEDEVNAMSSDAKQISITFSRKEKDFLKKALRGARRTNRRIPSLARTQLSVAVAANLEGYVANMIRLIFNTNLDILKSSKSTLKDDELIEGLKSGTTQHVLIEKRVRKTMYGSATDWISFLREHLGFRLESTSDVEELFLIRNCVLHNSGKVDRKLQDTKKKRYRNLGRPINITERDSNRYVTAAREISSAICREYARKFPASES